MLIQKKKKIYYSILYNHIELDNPSIEFRYIYFLTIL